jgi:hypothetical protein
MPPAPPILIDPSQPLIIIPPYLAMEQLRKRWKFKLQISFTLHFCLLKVKIETVTNDDAKANINYGCSTKALLNPPA